MTLNSVIDPKLQSIVEKAGINQRDFFAPIVFCESNNWIALDLDDNDPESSYEKAKSIRKYAPSGSILQAVAMAHEEKYFLDLLTKAEDLKDILYLYKDCEISHARVAAYDKMDQIIDHMIQTNATTTGLMLALDKTPNGSRIKIKILTEITDRLIDDYKLIPPLANASFNEAARIIESEKESLVHPKLTSYVNLEREGRRELESANLTEAYKIFYKSLQHSTIRSLAFKKVYQLLDEKMRVISREPTLLAEEKGVYEALLVSTLNELCEIMNYTPKSEADYDDVIEIRNILQEEINRIGDLLIEKKTDLGLLLSIWRKTAQDSTIHTQVYDKMCSMIDEMSPNEIIMFASVTRPNCGSTQYYRVINRIKKFTIKDIV